MLNALMSTRRATSCSSCAIVSRDSSTASGTSTTPAPVMRAAAALAVSIGSTTQVLLNASNTTMLPIHTGAIDVGSCTIMHLAALPTMLSLLRSAVPYSA
jgi:hypothetical protein